MFEDGKRLTVPAFAVYSIDDTTIESKRTVEVFRKYFTSEKNMELLYTLDGKNNFEKGSGCISVEKSYRPEERIAGFSHICFTIPPNDPHYGKNGDYRYCHHYDKEEQKDERAACLNDKESWTGEKTEENMKKYKIFSRLTYNPDFKKMLKKIDLFLDGKGCK